MTHAKLSRESQVFCIDACYLSVLFDEKTIVICDSLVIDIGVNFYY